MDDRDEIYGMVVHLPDGFARAGDRRRAVCVCGWSTTPRASEERAMAALLAGHRVDAAVCAICHRTRDEGPYPLRWRRHLEILEDTRDGQFLACRDDVNACRELAARRQEDLDRRAFEGLGLPAPGAYDVDERGCPDMDTMYTRCPVCGVVASAGSADYALTADGQLDTNREIRLTCVQAGHPYLVTAAQFLARDAVRTCSRADCGMTFGCPAEADQVCCPHCHLYQPGPFLNADPTRGAYVDQVRADWADDVRERLRRRDES